ncbi:MAG: polysaccharide biosynthesis protein [Psychromonas sp.]|nr:polysaccharide biosynthesis protein [Psychromonas sp.]
MNYFLSLPRFYKRLIGVLSDALFISVAFVGAFYIRLGDLTLYYNIQYVYLLLLLIISTLLLFVRVGLYRAVLRYLSLHALLTIIFSCIISAGFLIISGYFTHAFVPRTIPIIYVSFLIFLCGGARLLVRVSSTTKQNNRKIRTLIYGAGDAGRQLLYLLRQGSEFHPVAFIDDNKNFHNTVVNGLTVHNKKSLASLITRKRIDKMLLAIPSASRIERKMIIESLVELPIEVLSIPNFKDLLNGSATVDQLHDVPIEDLLGRDPVASKSALLGANINDKVVMVTGAGGSIGSELCRKILLQNPTVLILFELSECSLYQIDKELCGMVISQQLNVEIVPLLGSVQNQHLLERVLKSFKVQTLYHAAAYKHVPLVEYNVVEGIRNNIFGTYYTALACIAAKVESFVLISTDKAVRPTNVMGTTKRMAELSLQSLAAEEHDTRFCMVRFGNVLGSSGSVIPLFKQQIKKGDHVTITHPDMIRYFMTIPEAASLVIQAGSMGKGGDVFVLDMGKPVRIVDLATNLIKLSGLQIKSKQNPLGDIEIKFTGLRPGEKLFEELLIGNNVTPCDHEGIMRANESYLPYAEYKQILKSLDEACTQFDHKSIREILISVPAGFNPTNEIEDLVWKADQ